MGNKPIPTAIKLRNGNPGNHPLNRNEPQSPKLVELGEPPEWLGKYGRQEWHRVGPIFIGMNLLTEADLAAFTAYCAALDAMITAKIDMDKNGYTIRGPKGSTRNPAVSVFGTAVSQLRALASEFGATPSSRSRIQLPGDDGESLADLLGDNDAGDAS